MVGRRRLGLFIGCAGVITAFGSIVAHGYENGGRREREKELLASSAAVREYADTLDRLETAYNRDDLTNIAGLSSQDAEKYTRLRENPNVMEFRRNRNNTSGLPVYLAFSSILVVGAGLLTFVSGSARQQRASRPNRREATISFDDLRIIDDAMERHRELYPDED